MANKATIDLIKTFEGFFKTAYRCPAGILTIGYGHTGGVREGQICSQSEADDWLARDVLVAEKAVDRLVNVPLNANQHGALTSFVFNAGAGNLERSTLLKLLNKGCYDEIPAQLGRWNKANGQVLPGLTRRRAAEAVLWGRPPKEEA